MKLITEDLKTRFSQLGQQSKAVDPILVTKFTKGNTAYYPIEFNEERNEVCCFVSGNDNAKVTKWISVDELEFSIFGQGAKRDEFFTEIHFSNIHIDGERELVDNSIHKEENTIEDVEQFIHDDPEQNEDVDIGR